MSKRTRLNQWGWILALIFASCTLAQEQTSNEHKSKRHETIWRGSWVATAGPTRSLRGRWSAQLVPQTLNAAQGSWTLLGDSNQTLLEGTWSAHRFLHAWRGTWTARLASGQSLAGTWNSDLTDIDGQTFEDMFKRTIEKQVSGSWKSGRMQGNWWLQGTRW